MKRYYKYFIEQCITLVKLYYKHTVTTMKINSMNSKNCSPIFRYQYVPLFGRSNKKRTGSVGDLPHSGRPNTAVTTAKCELVAQTFVEWDNQSAVSVSRQLNISRTSLRRIVNKVGLKVYGPHLMHSLNEDDFD